MAIDPTRPRGFIFADREKAKERDRQKILKQKEREKEKARLDKERERKKRQAQRERERAKEKARKEKERAKNQARLKKAKAAQKQQQAERKNSLDVKQKAKRQRNISRVITPDTPEDELRKELRRLAGTVNRQARIMQQYQQEKGITNPALDNLIRSGGMISTNQESYEDLYFEYMRAKQFMDDITHTKRGFDEYIKEIIDSTRLENDNEPELSADETEEREEREEIPDNVLSKWEIFAIVEGTYPIIGADNSIKYNIAEYIENLMDTGMYTDDEIIEMASDRVEAMIKEMNDIANNMTPFDI